MASANSLTQPSQQHQHFFSSSYQQHLQQKEEGLAEETAGSNGKGHGDGEKPSAKAKAAALDSLRGDQYFQFHIECCRGQTNTESSTTKTTTGELSTTATTTFDPANNALYQPFRIFACWQHSAAVWVNCCRMGKAM